MGDPLKDVGPVLEQKHVLLMDGQERQAEACRRVFKNPGLPEFVAAEKKGEELYSMAAPIRKYADVRIYELTNKEKIDLTIQDGLTGKWESRELVGDEADKMRKAKEAEGDLRHFVHGSGWKSSYNKQWDERDLAAKMGDDIGKAEVAQALKDAELNIDSYSEHVVAKVLGVVDAALAAGDFGVVADVFAAINPLGGNSEVAGTVVEAAKRMVEKDWANLVIQAPDLKKLVLYGCREMDNARRLSLAEIEAMGYGYRTVVIAGLPRDGREKQWDMGEELKVAISFAPGIEDSADPVGLINRAKGLDNLIGGVRSDMKLWNEQTDPLTTARALAEVSKKDEGRKLSANGRVLEGAILGSIAAAVNGKADASKAADLLYGLCGEVALKEYMDGLQADSEICAKVFENLATRLSTVLEPKEAIKQGGGSMELFAKHFAEREKAKKEVVAQAEAVVAEEKRRAGEAVEAERRKAEEEKRKAAIEKAATELRSGLALEDLWKEEKDWRGRGKGTYVATDRWNETYKEVSRGIRDLRDKENLTPDEKIRLEALERHEAWLKEGSKSERTARR